MFQYFFASYCKRIYPVSTTRTRSLSREEIAELVFMISGIVIYIVATCVSNTKGILVSILLMIIGLIITLIARPDPDNAQLTKFDEKIDKLQKLLEEEDKYSKETIQWLIQACQIELSKEKEKKSLSMKSFFTIMIYPIIITVVSLLIDDLEIGTLFLLAVASIVVLLIIFITAKLLYSDVDAIVNRRKNWLEAFWSDLEYLLLQYAKADGASGVLSAMEEQVSEQ